MGVFPGTPATEISTVEPAKSDQHSHALPTAGPSKNHSQTEGYKVSLIGLQMFYEFILI